MFPNHQLPITNHRAKGRVLVIAGSDSGGGAGIQGDIKTITCLGGYAATAITALTAQNTQGVFGIHEVPIRFLRQQIELVITDIGADAIKTGMLHSVEVIECVADILGSPLGGEVIPLILDPVMFAKGGAALLQKDALDTLKTRLIPRAAIITPNIPEAEFLADMKIKNTTDMHKAGERLLKLGAKAALIKGGHLEGETITDLLLSENETKTFTSTRIHTAHTHGTGCTLASAIATGIAQNIPLVDAVARAREYVRKAIETAPQLGHGHGPLNHGHTINAG